MVTSQLCSVLFPSRQLPDSVLAVALIPLVCSSHSARPLTHPSLSARSPLQPAACGALEGLTYPLGSCHLGNCHLRRAIWKIPNTIFSLFLVDFPKVIFPSKISQEVATSQLGLSIGLSEIITYLTIVFRAHSLLGLTEWPWGFKTLENIILLNR